MANSCPEVSECLSLLVPQGYDLGRQEKAVGQSNSQDFQTSPPWHS